MNQCPHKLLEFRVSNEASSIPDLTGTGMNTDTPIGEKSRKT
jgi:hypothetical protein